MRGVSLSRSRRTLRQNAAIYGLLAALANAPAAGGCNDARPCKGQECSAPEDMTTEPPDAAVPLISSDAGTPRIVEADAACAMQTIRAEKGTRRPVDIIFVIDNSGSMTEEIAAVRQNIDVDFASIIEASGVDYRVIMLSLYGDGGTQVCIEPPLAGSACSAGIATTNGARYFHYNQEIGSHDALCQILDTLDRGTPGDDASRPEQGFQTWLRADAAKAFVLITDDGASCSYVDDERQVIIGADDADPFEDALAFHAALRAKSPEQFGGQYQFFSIVGFGESTGEPQPVFPHQPLDATTCSTAPSAGLSYQALSIATDALRYPVCEGRSFDAVFQVLARSVIQTATAECTYQIPEVEAPEVIILPSVNLEFRADSAAATQAFEQVADAAHCRDDHSFYIRDRIELCPDACRLLGRATDPQIDIHYGCSRAPD
ncbi:MAG: vWA domain-containing protein [Polyangiales bacterium]